MRVFMLGWEFPPFITGGLGTACYGLTKALSRQQTQVTFVLPKDVGGEFVEHVQLLSPQSPKAAVGDRQPESVASSFQMAPAPGVSPAAPGTTAASHRTAGAFANVTFKAVPARLPSPYASAGLTAAGVAGQTDPNKPVTVLDRRWDGPGQQYHGDLIQEAQRYADLCVDLARGQDFDVIHAHDWLTFPAGMAVAAATGKPLVVHVHSTEFDRSGDHIHQRIYDVERRGMHAAVRVIAVSHYTKKILEHRYGVPGSKVDVVYNGIDSGNGYSNGHAAKAAAIQKTDKIVLFLGRITMQKGPEYFVAAAKKVLEKYDRVKFVMAGSGDKVRDVIELAAEQGIGHKVLFTGFLRGEDVQKIFQMADVFVMPSVSEPFGIAPLEAISHDVPVIISKTSGVAEVLTHALKVDFWDTHDIANKILAVLRHPPLSNTLRQHADMELRRLTWDDAAARCQNVYERALATMPN